MTANCLIFVKIGGTNVLITDPRDIAGFLKELAKHPFTAITGVNTLFNALLHHPDFGRLDFSHLRNCLGGGMALHQAVAEKWKKITGLTLIEAYGLTEASPGVTMNPFNLRQFNGSVGLPLPSTEVSILDDQGYDLPIGQAGELCVRGPQVGKGYWKRPDETAKAIMPDGFLRTGDIASSMRRDLSVLSIARRTRLWSRASKSIRTRWKRWWQCTEASLKWARWCAYRTPIPVKP